jgi:tRNA U34 5-methylaminomethyl-2-thiouridine-forming methyltransferase MnmC
MPINNALHSSKKDLVLCEDGSYTFYSHVFKEAYHSTKDGALYESLEKHVKPALHLKSEKEKLTILDICFGLGYNTFATLYYIQKHHLSTKIHILSPEFDERLVRSLNTFNFPSEFDGIGHIITAIAEDLKYEDEQFKIEILLGDARQSLPKIKEKVDIVYQDAFSPVHNPLLWTREWFFDVRGICNEHAILTTYSTAAAIRLGLYENGFYIFVHRAPMMRYSTVASLTFLEGVENIDMELKKIRNIEAKSMRDEDYTLRTPMCSK